MKPYQLLRCRLIDTPKVWLVTGVAGFIGSNLLEALLLLDQRVVGLDNCATGSWRNLEQVRALVGPERWERFRHLQGDIRDLDTCRQATEGVDYLLHQAALGSVPRSIAHPAEVHACNVTGFFNVVLAARDNGVRRVVYASSSSVYGDHPDLPKAEHKIGRCLSPYAVTKLVDELYAAVFARCYDMEMLGLRYFNVFGPRQDPDGPYAAVIPRWISAMLKNEPVVIHGDGETTRDFCYVANVVQANLLAATRPHPPGADEVCNVAVHARTSLNQLCTLLQEQLLPACPHLKEFRPRYLEFRPGDVRHSEADISKAEQLLGYSPSHTVEQGLTEALEWYRENLV